MSHNTASIGTTKLHWTFWFGVGFFVLVLLSMLWSGWLLLQRVQADEVAPVTAVVIDGENPYTGRAEVLKALENISLNNFFKVDVDRVQQRLAQLPWVYSVSVRKQWPNQLKIYLVDQRPVAVWNGDFMINAQGQAFQADIAKLHEQLPQFFGPEGSEHIALENFNNINKLLAFEQLAIGELVLSERFAWQLTLTNGVTLNLGREHRFERIQRFLDVYQEINKVKKQNQQVDYVDLRYDTGLSVGWKPAEVKERV